MPDLCRRVRFRSWCHRVQRRSTIESPNRTRRCTRAASAPRSVSTPAKTRTWSSRTSCRSCSRGRTCLGDHVSRQFGVGGTHPGEWYLIGDGSAFQWALGYARTGEPRLLWPLSRHRRARIRRQQRRRHLRGGGRHDRIARTPLPPTAEQAEFHRQLLEQAQELALRPDKALPRPHHNYICKWGGQSRFPGLRTAERGVRKAPHERGVQWRDRTYRTAPPDRLRTRRRSAGGWRR